MVTDIAMLALPLALTTLFAGPTLELPYKCGKVETCTQGHAQGSHTGASQWAWDFVLSEGEEIWAASAGTVTHRKMGSTIGGCSSAYIADGNYITIDHGDGTSIIYAHMQANSSPLKVGDKVEVGDYLGRVGQTGYSCGAHLHMAVQEQCGSSHCQSVHGSFAEIGDPGSGESHESGNCPVCKRTLDGTTTVIDDEHAGCLDRKTTAWTSANNGYKDHHWFTIATDEAENHTRATWMFGVDVPGQYALEVFIPDAGASTTAARYVITHLDGKSEAVIDQSSQKGWQAVGTYGFVGGDGEGVKLGDATGEALDLGRKVAYDAIRLTWVGPLAEDPPPPDPGGSDSDGATSSGGIDIDGDLDETTGGAATTGGYGGDALPSGQAHYGDDGGCRVGGRRPAGWAWMWLGLCAIRRSARRRRAA